MIRVVAKFNLKPEKRTEAMALFEVLVRLTREENGCHGYDLAQSKDDENVYVIIEAWENQETLDVHSASEHFAKIVPQLVDMCACAPVIDAFHQVI